MERLRQPPDAYGAAIKARREELGLSQRALAARSGVARTHLADLEKGVHDPRRSTMCKLAEALEVEMADLFKCPDVVVAS